MRQGRFALALRLRASSHVLCCCRCPPSPARARGLEETRLKPLQRAISRMDGSRRSRHACT